jgi:hypothetical protein
VAPPPHRTATGGAEEQDRGPGDADHGDGQDDADGHQRRQRMGQTGKQDTPGQPGDVAGQHHTKRAASR